MLSLAVLLLLGCNPQGTSKEPSEVTFEQLMADPARYDGMDIEIEGYFYHGFETIVLSERLDPSGYAEGHLVPKGSMLWIEGGIPREIYDGLHQQQMMGPSERYGRLMIKGLFEYGGEYGHLGQFEYQLKPSLVKLLN
ncbi:hypothetical protein ACFLUY_00815 [Chloroflexota bacterium]